MPDFTSSRHRTRYLQALNILSAMGIPLSGVAIRAAGTYENYRGEIRSQDPPAGTPVTPETPITLEIGVDSIVDRLPYQFFYGFQGARDSDHAWEENARSLLAPFDAAVIRYDARMRAYDLRYRFGMADPEHVVRFMDLFEFSSDDASFALDDVLMWASILPSLHAWGGNPEIVSSVLSILLKREFRIAEHARATTPIPKDLQYRLGAKTGRLGQETLLGERFEECDSTYEVEVHGVPAKEVRLFLPGGALRRRIEKILDYCMPGELEYRIVVKVDRGGPGTAAEPYLGYSSFI